MKVAEKIYKYIVERVPLPMEHYGMAFDYINTLAKYGLYETIEEEGKIRAVALFYYTDEPLLQIDASWELPDEDLLNGENVFISIVYADDETYLRKLKNKLIDRFAIQENLKAAYWYNHKIPHTLMRYSNKKEVKMIGDNCGLKALNRLLSKQGLNGDSVMSLYTLQNIAMDNGIRVYAVEIKEPQGVRVPYIAYDEDKKHFYVSERVESRYGLVTELTPAVRRLKHREAISIKGGKGGGLRGFIAPLAGFAASVIPGLQPIAPLVTAAGTAYGAVEGARRGGVLGGITGALSGYGGSQLGAAIGGGLRGGLSSTSGFMSGFTSGARGAMERASISNLLSTPANALRMTTPEVLATGTSTLVSNLPGVSSYLPAAVRATQTSLGTALELGQPLTQLANLTPPSSSMGTEGISMDIGYRGLPEGAAETVAETVAEQPSSVWDVLTKPIFGESRALSPVSLALRLGSMGIETPYPSMEARNIYSETARRLLGGEALTPAGRAAQEQLVQQVQGGGWTEADERLYGAAVERIDKNTEQRLKQLENYYARYNALDSGEYREAVRKTLEEADLQKSRLLGELQLAALNRQMQAIAQATGYDLATIDRLLKAGQLVGYDEELRTMIKANDYDNLRKALNTLRVAVEGGGEIDNPADYDMNLAAQIRDFIKNRRG